MTENPDFKDATPDALAAALMRPQVNRAQEPPLEPYEALLRECELCEGEERESAKNRLFQVVGLSQGH